MSSHSSSRENNEGTLTQSRNNGGDETMEGPEVLQLSLPQSIEDEDDMEQSYPLDVIGPSMDLPTFPNSLSTMFQESGNHDGTLIETFNNGGQRPKVFKSLGENEVIGLESRHLEVIPETLENSDFSTNSVITPTPPPHPLRLQLRAKVQLPSKDFCLNRALPILELVVELDGDPQEFIVKIDLHKKLRSRSQPEPQKQGPSVPTERENILNNSFPSISPPLTPPPLNSTRSEDQFQSDLDILPGRKLPSRAGCPTSRNKKEVIRPQVKVNPKVAQPNKATEDVIDERAGFRYPCYFCHSRFQVPSHLNNHILVHTTEKPYPCDKCGRQFNHKSNLTSHRRLHDPATRRPFSCEECGKTFKQKGNLTTHVKVVHRGVKDYQCPECDRKFGSKSDMTSHLKSIHYQIPYQCPNPKCKKTFASRFLLWKHKQTAHPKNRKHGNIVTTSN